MFARFQPTKLKLNLKLAITRYNMLQKKRENLNQQARREIAKLLEKHKDDMARIKVEQIIRDDIMLEVMEIMEMYLTLLSTRFGMIDNKDKYCDPGLLEVICTVLWITPRMQNDIHELKEIKHQFGLRYGKEFIEGAMDNRDNTVNTKIIHKMSIHQPGQELVEGYLTTIAQKYHIDYTPPDTFESFPEPPNNNSYNSGGSNSYGGGFDGGMPSLPDVPTGMGHSSGPGMGFPPPGQQQQRPTQFRPPQQQHQPQPYPSQSYQPSQSMQSQQQEQQNYYSDSGNYGSTSNNNAAYPPNNAAFPSSNGQQSYPEKPQQPPKQQQQQQFYSSNQNGGSDQAPTYGSVAYTGGNNSVGTSGFGDSTVGAASAPMFPDTPGSGSASAPMFPNTPSKTDVDPFPMPPTSFSNAPQPSSMSAADLPELPSIPSNSRLPGSTSADSTGTGSAVPDFDELTRRFDALRKTR